MNNTDVEIVKKLASLSPFEYDRIRDAEAENLGVRVSSLDAMVKKEHNKMQHDNPLCESIFDDIQPWPEEVDGEELMCVLSDILRQFVVLSEEQAVAVSGWILFTYFMEVVETAPILNIASPEKRCGKTTLLAILTKLVMKPLSTSNITPAALYRTIEQYRPTLLIDECDTFINDERSELRGIINSGYTRTGSFVIRTVGDNHDPKPFSTWSAKCLAGIGNLPETIKDRSIVIELRRKLKEETKKKIRELDKSLVLEIQQKCLRFSLDNAEELRKVKVSIPEKLNDRASDNWEPLLAIAYLAGNKWYTLTQEAASLLSNVDEETMSVNVELLKDIQSIFEEKQVDRLSTSDLIEALCIDDEAPWMTYNHGQRITARQLAKKLKDFSITSRSIRVSSYSTPKGYCLKDFEDAFKRYIPSLKNVNIMTRISATPPQTAPDAVDHSFSYPPRCSQKNESATLETTHQEGCGGVADKTPLINETILDQLKNTVRCAECKNFEPDITGDGTGIGTCSVNTWQPGSLLFYPNIERSCEKFNAKEQ